MQSADWSLCVALQLLLRVALQEEGPLLPALSNTSRELRGTPPNDGPPTGTPTGPPVELPAGDAGDAPAADSEGTTGTDAQTGTATQVVVAQAETGGAGHAGTEAENAASLMRAFEDDKLCDHFLQEPYVDAGKMKVRIVRVGPPASNTFNIRPKSVGVTPYKRCNALWAVDSDNGCVVYFARVCNTQGVWSRLLRADSANKLACEILKEAGASKSSRVSAQDFFGVPFFQKQGSKHFKFPKPSSPPRCFACSASITSRSRYNEVTLARLCDSSACKNRKRKSADTDESDGLCLVLYLLDCNHLARFTGCGNCN